ncbi:hypothetical protein ES288_A06G067100v1 [Gossypium darwinii]|uniref:Uncharacterized protein n=1 Tax=Gossypium darwinii TaxID=34276 RepID=A0A5D2G5W1_GOSDA|nr:hypothetical protein ES288_A06G067100v1 [Gossypium darwinii]
MKPNPAKQLKQKRQFGRATHHRSASTKPNPAKQLKQKRQFGRATHHRSASTIEATQEMTLKKPSCQRFIIPY